MTDANTLNCTYRSSEVTISLDHVVDEAGENGEYLLEWTDGINEWAESYDRPDVALARFAVLVAGVTQDRFLTSDEGDFPPHAQRFLDSQLDPTAERSKFRRGQLVSVRGSAFTYTVEFLREERNQDNTLNGVALVRITEHPEAVYVGTEIHVGISVLEPA